MTLFPEESLVICTDTVEPSKPSSDPAATAVPSTLVTWDTVVPAGSALVSTVMVYLGVVSVMVTMTSASGMTKEIVESVSPALIPIAPAARVFPSVSSAL